MVVSFLLLDHSSRVAGIGIGPTAPGGLAESEGRIELDGAMEPAEEDRHRPQEDVNRVANKVGDQLDEL